MKTSLNRNIIWSLLIAVILPFIIIMVLVLPLSIGLHGTTHSEFGNEYSFRGSEDYFTEYSTGHYRGDVFIENNTGWIFCNGKVRFSGEVHLTDADFDYVLRQKSQFVGIYYDYQEIDMNGDKCTMEEGFPSVLLGLIGSAFGLIGWFAWYLARKGTKYGIAILSISFILGMISLGLIGFFRVFPVVIVILAVLATLFFLANVQKYYSSGESQISGVAIIVGLFMLIFSAISIAFPTYYFWGWMSDQVYSETLAMQSVFFGMIGLLSSAGMIGFGTEEIIQTMKNSPNA